MKSSKRNLLSFKNRCLSPLIFFSNFFFSAPLQFLGLVMSGRKNTDFCQKTCCHRISTTFWQVQKTVHCMWISVCLSGKLRTPNLHRFLHHKLEYKPRAISFLLLTTEVLSKIQQHFQHGFISWNFFFLRSLSVISQSKR